jgi:hypothetical protein
MLDGFFLFSLCRLAPIFRVRAHLLRPVWNLGQPRKEDFLAKNLAFIVAFGHRFQELYHFSVLCVRLIINMAASVLRPTGALVQSALGRTSTSFGFARKIAVSTRIDVGDRRRSFARHSSYDARNHSLGAQVLKSFTPVPFVTETLGSITHTTDLFSRLLKEVCQFKTPAVPSTCSFC